jgi:hypothetical protein
LVKKTFDFLGQYIKFHEVDVAIISQFQYKHEATTYGGPSRARGVHTSETCQLNQISEIVMRKERGGGGGQGTYRKRGGQGGLLEGGGVI